MHILNLPVPCHSSTAISQRRTRHLAAQSKLRIGLYMTTWQVYPFKSRFRELNACSYKPAVCRKAYQSRVNYFCVHVTVLSHLISRLGGTKLCKHGIFEIFFVVIKQTALYVTILVVFSNCAVEYHIISQKSAKNVHPSRVGKSLHMENHTSPSWLVFHI